MKNIKYLLLIGVALPGLVFAGSTTNKGANPNGKPFIELAGQIIEVEGEISTLQDQVDSLVDDVDDLAQRVTANEAAITSLQATNVDLQAQITANQDGIADLQSEVAILEADNSDLRIQINAFGDADGALQAAIDTNAAWITTLNQSITDLGVSLQNQIDNNVGLIAVMQDQIDNLNVVGAERTRIENGVCASGETIYSYNPTTGDFSCQRFYEAADGTTGSHPVEYKSVTVGAGRIITGYLGCDLNYPQWNYAANLSYGQSGGLELLQLYRHTAYSYRYTWRNTTSEAQVANMAVECRQRY